MEVCKLKIPKICEHCGKPFEAKTVITRFWMRVIMSPQEHGKKKEQEEKHKQQILQKSAATYFAIFKAGLKQVFEDGYWTIDLSTKIKGIQEQNLMSEK
ncbi:MAG: hypothetical protein LBR10_06815 [Prevotellaceae bacterium]|jgi:hypothetical protein|nr:hypothetical protein [Prevotellaceae bacterium]